MLNFTNRYFESMPHDPVESNYTRQVAKAMLSKVTPTPVSDPRLLGYSTDVASLLGVSHEDIGRGRLAQSPIRQWDADWYGNLCALLCWASVWALGGTTG